METIFNKQIGELPEWSDDDYNELVEKDYDKFACDCGMIVRYAIKDNGMSLCKCGFCDSEYCIIESDSNSSLAKNIYALSNYENGLQKIAASNTRSVGGFRLLWGFVIVPFMYRLLSMAANNDYLKSLSKGILNDVKVKLPVLVEAYNNPVNATWQDKVKKVKEEIAKIVKVQVKSNVSSYKPNTDQRYRNTFLDLASMILGVKFDYDKGNSDGGGGDKPPKSKPAPKTSPKTDTPVINPFGGGSTSFSYNPFESSSSSTSDDNSDVDDSDSDKDNVISNDVEDKNNEDVSESSRIICKKCGTANEKNDEKCVNCDQPLSKDDTLDDTPDDYTFQCINPNCGEQITWAEFKKNNKQCPHCLRRFKAAQIINDSHVLIKIF